MPKAPRLIGRPTGTRYGWTPADKAEFVRLYCEEEWSIDDIAVKYDVSSRTIQYHLHRLDTAMRRTGCMTERAKDKQRGPNHHSWAGGRYMHSGGYVLALAIGHPHAHDDYVAEHRLVVERHLQSSEPAHSALGEDGYLRRSWVVHHVNGNKADNRLENLEAMPRENHHSWMHYREELAALKAEVETLRAAAGI